MNLEMNLENEEEVRRGQLSEDGVIEKEREDNQ